jgi:hypothetical protein
LEKEGERILNYKENLKKRVNERGELAKYMKERQAETAKKQTETHGNSEKQAENTEGGKMANMDLKKLAKQLQI